MASKNTERERAYQQEYNKNNRERLTQYQSEWRQTPAGQAYLKEQAERIRHDPKRREKAKEASRKSSRKKYAADRLALIEFYGGKCVRCGFSDPRALQIDHIHGGGRKELQSIDRKKYHSLEYHKKNKGKYQLLCSNCNWIKRDECQEYSSTSRTCP